MLECVQDQMRPGKERRIETPRSSTNVMICSTKGPKESDFIRRPCRSESFRPHLDKSESKPLAHIKGERERRASITRQHTTSHHPLTQLALTIALLLTHQWISSPRSSPFEVSLTRLTLSPSLPLPSKRPPIKDVATVLVLLRRRFSSPSREPLSSFNDDQS